MSKKRAKCPRLYLLNDEDLLEVVCCGCNLSRFAAKVGLVFNQIQSLKCDVSGESSRVVGCYGRTGEYFPLKQAVSFRGSVEELINELEKALPETLAYLLELALKGLQPPHAQTQVTSSSVLSPSPMAGKKSDSPTVAAVTQAARTLTPIHESGESQVASTSLFSWMFQHVSQVVELSLRILLTKQIEACLGKPDDLRVRIWIINFL
jgi:hypothetical protein